MNKRLNWGFTVLGVIDTHVPQSHIPTLEVASRTTLIAVMLTDLLCQGRSRDPTTSEHELESTWVMEEKQGLKYSEPGTSLCRVLPNHPVLKEPY